MGGFLYLSKKPNSNIADLAGACRKQFALQGFREPVSFVTDRYVLDYYGKFLAGQADIVTFPNGDFVFAVGTFLYRGLIGRDALQRFYEADEPLRALREARGHFAVVLRKNGQIVLLPDPAGAYEIFLTQDGACVTSSFLAAIAAAPARTINPHEVYEYVFNGTTLGNRTLFAEIRRLDLGERMVLDPGPSIVQDPLELPGESTDSFSDAADRNLRTLLDYTSELVALFGDNIRIALSGGYDSRFLVALFRKSGITPRLFVYGADTDEDVVAARRIAAAENIPLDHVNKALLRRVGPDEYADVIRTNFFREDALPSGGIFVNGAELIAREQRNSGGALHVNGGGGEIYRNFFNLFDRPLRPRDFVWVFYSGYDPACSTAQFDSRAYDKAIANKVTALLRTGEKLLTRRQVEALYPYFRCRAWFGHENSINSRWGFSVLPFFEYRTVQEALRVPVRYKYFGNLESTMLRRADPSLARHLSNYGHSFDRNAPLSVMAADLSTYLRPAWARRLTFRIRQRLAKKRPRIALLSEALLKQVLDIEFPYMSKYFRFERCDESQMSRICTLEYLFSRVNAR